MNFPFSKVVLPIGVIFCAIGLRGWHRVPSALSVAASAFSTEPSNAFTQPSAVPLPPPDRVSQAGTATQFPAKTSLSQNEWQSIAQQIVEANLAFVEVSDTPGCFRAFNRSGNLAFSVSSGGVEIRPRIVPSDAGGPSPASNWSVRLKLADDPAKNPFVVSNVFEDSASSFGLRAATNRRVEIQRDTMTEWYVHTRRGLEQGFTINSPESAGHGPLTIRLAVESTLTPKFDESTRAIGFLDDADRTILRYEALHAFDATGRALESRMLVANRESIELQIDITGAAYPVTIDPLLTTQPLALHEDTVPAQYMDSAIDQKNVVALDGDTLAVGETTYNAWSGAVSIFCRQSDGSWQFEKRIQAAGAPFYHYFGTSVALDGDTLIVGDRASPGNNTDDGAYIFQRNEGGTGNWGQVAELQPDSSDIQGYGNAVAIRSGWAFVGAQEGGTSNPTGRVYVYQKNQGGAGNWGLVQTLQASTPANYDYFGASIAVSPSGESLVIGAPNVHDRLKGVAYLFTATAGSFGVACEIAPPTATRRDFGKSVSISDSAVLVRSTSDSEDLDFHGSVSVYNYQCAYEPMLGRVICQYTFLQEILPPEDDSYPTFGHSLHITDSYLCIGYESAKSGTEYKPEPLFFYQPDPAAGIWALSRSLYNPQSAVGCGFASSFAIDNGRIAVASTRDPAEGTNKYVQIFSLDASGGDHLGTSVAVETDSATQTIVVGAPDADGQTADSGAAYVFEKQNVDPYPWQLKRKIIASDGASGDHFGFSIDIDQNIVVVGAPEDDDNGENSGAAYAFDRNYGGSNAWGQTQKFAPSDTISQDCFGYSVGVWGGRVVAGAPYHDAFGQNEGTVYVYEGGTFKAKFNGFLAGPGDAFGFSVSIDGNYIIAGAPYNDFNGGLSNSGTAIVFKRDGSSGDWSEFSTLFPSTAEVDACFGLSVSVSGANALVGAPYRDEGGTPDSGAAYLFTPICALTCTETKKLTPHDGGTNKEFGCSVALDLTRAAVGSQGLAQQSDPSYLYPGAIYVFEQYLGGANNWGEAMIRRPRNGAPCDRFGHAVAIDGDTIAAGALLHDGPQPESGAAYFFGYDANDPPTSITLHPSFVYENKPVGTVVGTLSAVDPDIQDWHIFTFVDGDGAEDNAMFAIDGNHLLTAVEFDYETATSRHIHVRATDQTGALWEESFVVTIEDVPGDQDDDGDGLTRAQEDKLGTGDHNCDSDGDGFEDGIEYYCMHTDPADPDSGPYRLAIEGSGYNLSFGFSWNSQPNIAYYLESSPDMTPDSWGKVAGSDMTATGTRTTIQLRVPVDQVNRMFYRVRTATCTLPSCP